VRNTRTLQRCRLVSRGWILVSVVALSAVTDIEGATVIGGDVLWVTSHSLNKDGADRPNRKVLLATPITGSSSLGAETRRVSGSLGGPAAPVGHRRFLLQAQATSLEGILIEARGLALLFQLPIPLQKPLSLLGPVDHLLRGHLPTFGPRAAGLHPRKGE